MMANLKTERSQTGHVPAVLQQVPRGRDFLVGLVRGFAPGLVWNVIGTLIVYTVARGYFDDSSLTPLLLASLVPVAANAASLGRQRRIDLFGAMVLLGLLVAGAGVLFGGGPRLLLVRESFTTAAIGLALLGSLALRRPLGYYFARQLLSGNEQSKERDTERLLNTPAFRRAMRGGTLFWGCLLLGEFVVRVAMVAFLPVLAVLVLSPIVFNAAIVVGIVISGIWAARVARTIAATA